MASQGVQRRVNFLFPKTSCRAGTCPRRCRNCRLRTNRFHPYRLPFHGRRVGVGTADFVQTRSTRTARRCADGGDMSPPYKGWFVYRGALFACGLQGATRCGNLVQELPTAYKFVRLYCLPLRGRRGHVPALHWNPWGALRRFSRFTEPLRKARQGCRALRGRVVVLATVN